MSSAVEAPKGLRWWFQSVPAERLAVLRVLVGLYSVIYFCVRIPYWLSFARHRAVQFDPVGVLVWMDAPMSPGLYQTLVVLTALGSVLFFIGAWYKVAAPVFAALLFVVLCYANSWGTVLHTDNLWLAHVVALSMAPAADAVSYDARSNTTPLPAHFKYGWAIRLMCLVCVCAYFIAGLAKVKNSGLDFVGGETLRNYVAMDNVRKLELGSPFYSPLAVWMLEYTATFRVLAMGSMVLELGAPVAMMHRYIAKPWTIAMWGFHVGVLALMAIGFFYPITFIAFAPFWRVERLLRFFPERFRGASAPAPA